MIQSVMTQSGADIDLTGGKSFVEFIGLYNLRDVQLSPEFERSVKDFGKVTLVVFADLECPDCLAVLPFLGKISYANPSISVVFGEWNAQSEKFLQDRLGTARVPTVLALDAAGKLMDGAFIERPLAVHRAAAGASSRKDAMLIVEKFRNGGADALIEEDLLKILNGAKIEVLRYLK